MIIIKKSAVTFLALMVAGFVAGQAAPAPAQAVSASQTSNSPSQLQQRNPRYVIQRQDVLLLSFPLTPEFNQTVTVQPDGYVNLQNSASLHVQGLTVPDMVSALKTAYAGTLHDPIVNVDLVDYQKPLFTVTGQVGKPGQYELRADITVAEALAVAGGLSPTAKTQVFLFHRTSADWFAVREIKMKDILNGKHVNEDAHIEPGDMIFVPEKFITNFKKYVPYSLNASTFVSQD